MKPSDNQTAPEGPLLPADRLEGQVVYQPESDPFYEAWVLEIAAWRQANSEAALQCCHEHIQLILAYTLLLSGVADPNPFHFSLGFSLHPRMNLI